MVSFLVLHIFPWRCSLSVLSSRHAHTFPFFIGLVIFAHTGYVGAGTVEFIVDADAAGENATAAQVCVHLSRRVNQSAGRDETQINHNTPESTISVSHILMQTRDGFNPQSPAQQHQ
jgi:hypothetical protein